MKSRLFLLLSTVLLWFTATYAQEGLPDPALTTPEAGQEYFIVHSSGFFLSSDGGTLRIMSPGAVLGQRFVFEAVDGTDGAYNIKLVETGQYLKTDGYSLRWTEDTTDPLSHYALTVSYVTTNITISCLGKDAGWNCLGTDNNNDGGGVYGDKAGNDGKHLWYLQVATDDIITTGLESAIANAENTLAEATIGDGPGEYPQSSADVLQEAINVAKGVLENPTDQATVNAAADTLNAATSVFVNSMNTITLDPEKKYWIMQVVSGLVWDTDGSGFQINNPTGAATQQYVFVPVEGEPNVYNIQVSDGSGYFAWEGGWSSVVSTDPTADDAKWVIELMDVETETIAFNRHARNGHIGTDDAIAGSSIYTNKGTGGRSDWRVIEYVEGQLFTEALSIGIANAQAALADIVIGEEPWQYSQEAVDALNAAIAAAQQALATATTQEEVNAASGALATAISTFENGWNKPVFAPAPGEKYRFAVAKYSTNYMTVSGGSIGTAEYTAGDANQHWEFEAAGDGSYYVLNNGQALSTDFTLVDKASAPTWKMVYTTTNNVDWFSLVTPDTAQVLTFSSGTNPALQDFQASNNAHQGRFTKVDLPNDPDRTALENAIGNARTTLRNIDRGNEIGQWSDAKCDAFEAIIEEAEALTGADQEAVDAMAQKLNDARTEFINSPNQVIKDDLEGMLNSAKELLDNAVVGIQVGEWYQSALDEAYAQLADYQEKAETVTEQEDADALTAEVGEWVDTLTGNTEVQEVHNVFNDAVECLMIIAEEAESNIGYDLGQYPQEAYDVLLAVIFEANFNTPEPTVEDLNALQAARKTFLESVITVDRAALKTAIEKAQGEEFQNLVAGEYDGNYPQENIDAFNDALEAAQAALTNLELTQDDIDTLTDELNGAMTTLTASKVVIDFASLDERIALAESLIATVTEIGEGEGQCPQSVVDALQSVIDGAKEIDRAAVTQATVDELVASINTAIETFRVALIESTGLQALIDEAQALHDGATQGLKPGNYPSTACTQLQDAIDAAAAVIANEESTQAQLLEAVAALQKAMDDFGGKVIPPHDLTELEALIAECDAFIAETGADVALLNSALAEAKAVVENPNDYTSLEVKDITETLEEALEYAKMMSGINEVALSQLTITTGNGILKVAGLEGENIIRVYSTSGALVGSVMTAESEYSFSLTSGAYILSIAGEKVNGNRTVIVK